MLSFSVMLLQGNVFLNLTLWEYDGVSGSYHQLMETMIFGLHLTTSCTDHSNVPWSNVIHNCGLTLSSACVALRYRVVCLANTGKDCGVRPTVIPTTMTTAESEQFKGGELPVTLHVLVSTITQMKHCIVFIIFNFCTTHRRHGFKVYE